MEKEFGRIAHDGERHPLNEDNTELYTHRADIVDALGSLATRDHLFFRIGDTVGYYMWAHHPDYNGIREQLPGTDARQDLNRKQVDPTDNKKYEQHLLADLNNTESIPEEWLN